MDIVYTYQGITFEWHGQKSLTNFQKHGISFEEATEVFFDPFYIEGDASRDEEERTFILGYSLSQHILLVVNTQRQDRTRIISARKATFQEMRLYDER